MRIYGKIEVCVMKKLDKVDKKIIQILQKNARTPLKEIAAQVFLSSPSVSARIEKLEHEGVIIGYTARVNPLYLNYHIKAFINLEVERNQPKKEGGGGPPEEAGILSVH